MRPPGSGGTPASAALPLLDNVPHCLRRGALHLPTWRSERGPCYDSDRLLVSRKMPTFQKSLMPGEGWTELHEAARRGNLDAVRRLLEHGADPNAREPGDNTTPLHWAAAHGHVDIVRALLDAGA